MVGKLYRWMLLCLSTPGLCEVSLVAFGEVAVVDDASFGFGYRVGCGCEGSGCVVDGEPSLGAVAAQVRCVGDVGRVDDQLVGLACGVALGAAGYLASGLALGGEAGGVGDAALVDAQAGHRDAPQCVVGLAVAAAVEPVAHRWA